LSVVIDANLLVALALNDPRAPAVDRHLREWASAGENLHAPQLLRYEAANALTRAIVAGHLARDGAATAWERITRVDVQLHTLADGAAAVETALRLERSNAYERGVPGSRSDARRRAVNARRTAGSQCNSARNAGATNRQLDHEPAAPEAQPEKESAGRPPFGVP
jgi:predicted nucleic acid-binding protein